MRFHPAACLAWIILLPCILLGCAESDESQPAPPPPSSVETPTQTEVDLGGLPELGDYVSGLDKSRLDVARPEGWVLASRSTGYLVRFLRSDQEQYPMILVTGEDYQGLADVSSDNVDEFAQQIKAAESISGPVEPITVGRFVGVSYQKRGKEPRSVNRILERLLVVTVVGGRKYGVELRAREGRIDDAKQCLFAVVNGIRFLGPSADKDDADNPVAKESDSATDVDEKTEEKPKPKEKSLDDILN